jgi:hypothetical protein
MGKPSRDVGVTRTKPTLCPYCGYLADSLGTTDGSPGAPSPGDISICLNCAEVQVIADDMTLRKATPADLAEIAADPEWAASVRDAQTTLRSMQRAGLRTKQHQRGTGPRN